MVWSSTDSEAAHLQCPVMTRLKRGADPHGGGDPTIPTHLSIAFLYLEHSSFSHIQ